MADPRTFTLIGNFTDNITPALTKINKSLEEVKANLESVSKSTKPLKKDFQDLADLSGKFSTSLKGQASDIRDITNAMKAMRQEMGRVNRAYRAGGRNAIRDTRRLAPPPPPPPRTPRFAAPPPPPPPRTPRFTPPETPSTPPPSQFARRGARGTSFAAGAGGAVAGYQLGEMITNSILRGFQLGVSIMEKPFQYFGNALGERVQDQMQDLKAAGAFYSIAQRQQKPFLTSIDEAIQFQQDSNRAFAKMAAALPGVTNDYVQVSKRVGDTIARIVTSDMPNAIIEANKVRATEEGRQFYGGQITGTGPKQVQQAITTLTGELTKKTVLAGLGGRAGAGGMMGAYGLPGLAERMLSQDKVSMGQFQRYAAIFGDPMIADALNRNVEKINATEKNSLARLNAFNKMMDEIVTPELIDKLRTSVDGVYQGLKSAILDPDTGLFGLGRQMQGMGKRMNSFGQYLDKFNKVTDDVNKAADDDLSLFEMMADIFSKAGQVLTPIVTYLPEIFDPLKNIGKALIDARTYTAKFALTFNSYREGLKVFAKTLDDQSKLKIMETLDIRASLAAVNNLFAEFGVYGADATKDFSRIANMLKDPKANIGAILSELVNTFFSSDIAKNIGEFIGNVVGTVIKTVGDMLAGVTDFASAGPFAQGLKKGWDAAQGSLGVTKIFQSIFKVIGNAILEAFKAAPFEMSLLTALTVGMPILSGLITTSMAKLFEVAFAGGASGLKAAMQAMVAKFSKVKPVTVKDLGTVVTDPKKMLAPAKGTSTAAIIPAEAEAGGAALSRLLGLFSKLAVVLTAIIVVGGGVTGTLRQLQQSFGEAWNSLTGAFGGLFDSLGVLTGFVGDLGRRIGDVIGSLFGVKGELDGLKIAFAPITLALQALNLGLRGIALALAEFRVFLARITGDKQYQQRIKERDEMAVKLAQDQGRINAYNASMLGKANVQKQINDAVFELQNSKTLKAARSAELKAFIAEAKIQLGNKSPVPPAVTNATPTPASKTTTPTTTRPNIVTTAAPKTPTTPKPVTVDQLNAITRSLGGDPTKPVQSPKIVPTGTITKTPVTAPPQTPNPVVTQTAALNQKATAQITQATAINKNTLATNTTLGNIRAGIIAVSNKLSQIQASLNSMYLLMASGSLTVKTATAGAPGLGGASVGGGVDSFSSIAQAYGLSMTSGYRPGDPGWHGANRARDYSNGTGPTPQMMQFAQYMASTYGTNLKELIYTPLGYSIKNGSVVPPYAQSGHYNHVHVAYATGLPTFFGSQSDALAWENKATLGNVKVSSITARQGEFGGSGPINITAPITINQQPGQNADELASIVAIKIGEAVADARAASIFV